jgi:orotate phosphoribosyltransferase
MKTSHTKQAVIVAGVLQEGHFVFADGDHATQKLEMDNLWDHPAQLRVVVQALADADGLPLADVLLGVPTGGQRLADAVGEMSGLPVVQLERVSGGAKQDFRYVSSKDKELALSARAPRIIEDVVTTLSSVAGVVRLLHTEQDIQSLAIWRRGEVKPQYQRGVSDYYLVEEPIASTPAAKCAVCIDFDSRS